MVIADVEEPSTDVLDFGPRSPSRRSRRAVLAVTAAVVAAAVAFGAWWFWPKPPPIFTLNDLEGVYTGMVRADGTNDMALVSAATMRATPVVVSPRTCEPLFLTAQGNQFPAAALDGVSTYWTGATVSSPVTVSLVTFRYPTVAAAEADARSVASVLTNCLNQPIMVRTFGSSTYVAQQLPTPTADSRSTLLAFSLDDRVGSTRWDVWLMRQTNTVSWEFRYDSSGRSDPGSGRLLMTGLATQMRAVQDAKVI